MSTVHLGCDGQPMRRLLLLVPAVCAANDTLLDGIDIAGHLGSPLTAGCSMIFLDLGANLGVQTRKLFEAEKYTKGKRPPVFRLFANAFGLDRDVWRTACSVGFEPSPFLWPRLAELGKRYAALGFRATFLRAGVGASRGACAASKPTVRRRFGVGPVPPSTSLALSSIFRVGVIGDGGPAVVATMASETAGPRERDGPRR